ncbi:MAG: gamma-glutamyl-gamma-aminobutyrate hydrolase family protein [Ornithinimicrobium sp.]
MGDRPLIAVPTRFAASTSALRYEAEVSSRRLIAALYEGGGEPWMMHPDAPGSVVADADVAHRLARADGVLLPGGGDVNGHWSGQSAHPTLYDVDDEQDAFDLAVARVALAHGIPLLSVCRGTQIVTVARGGTLVQDMDEAAGSGAHHRHRVHAVTVDQGSLTADVLGERVEVSCYHHQCLDTLGADMFVTGRSAEGVIESVEIRDAPGWYLGVQWHPEDTFDSNPAQQGLFTALVDAAR